MVLSAHLLRLGSSNGRGVFVRRPRVSFPTGSLQLQLLAHVHRPCFGSRPFHQNALHKDFYFASDFFNTAEQKILLKASLKNLDALGTRQMRRKRDAARQQMVDDMDDAVSIQHIFLPDEYYEFEEVR